MSLLNGATAAAPALVNPRSPGDGASHAHWRDRCCAAARATRGTTTRAGRGSGSGYVVYCPVRAAWVGGAADRHAPAVRLSCGRCSR